MLVNVSYKLHVEINHEHKSYTTQMAFNWFISLANMQL